MAGAAERQRTGPPTLCRSGRGHPPTGTWKMWMAPNAPISDPSAGWLFEVERCMWSSDEPLVIDTPAEALAAFRQAREYEEGRKRRYREAMIHLGRPLQGPSRYEEESSLAN